MILKILFLILIVPFLAGCAADGSFDWSKVPMIQIEDPETGLVEGCKRIPAEKLIRCSKVISGKNVITDFPIDDPPVEIKKE